MGPEIHSFKPPTLETPASSAQVPLAGMPGTTRRQAHLSLFPLASDILVLQPVRLQKGLPSLPASWLLLALGLPSL